MLMVHGNEKRADGQRVEVKAYFDVERPNEALLVVVVYKLPPVDYEVDFGSRQIVPIEALLLVADGLRQMRDRAREQLAQKAKVL